MLTLDEGAVAQSAATPLLLPSSYASGAARRLIFVTNRGPIEHHQRADGAYEARLGAGGVVSGLLCAARERPVSWISVAMTDGDRAVARAERPASVTMPADLSYLTPRLVYTPEQVYSRYYDEISNQVLWFAHHELLAEGRCDGERIQTSWHDSYTAVNRALADAVVAELEQYGEDMPVMFHDYHLYLAPAMVRRRVPRARLQHFVHVPWPAPHAWASVPQPVIQAIYEGLAANDVIGFQTPRDAHNFLAGARRYLPGAVVSRDPDELRCVGEGRRTLIRAYPIALTPESVRASARCREAVQQAGALRAQLKLDEGRQLIVRVDRVEPTKNIVRGFEAYERLLAEHAHLRGRVTFLALLVPSRESVPEYRAYAEQVRKTVERINAAYGEPGWDPIVAIYGNDRARALACMRDYDVLLVNSLADGMNLVVKEGGLVNTRDGVIVLSERAGAYVQLRNAVLGIAPRDVEGTAQALYQALTMSAEERRRRARAVREILECEDAASWLGRQLADLMRVTGLPAEPDELDPADADDLAALDGAEPALLSRHVSTSAVRAALTPASALAGAPSPNSIHAPMRHLRAATLPLPRPRDRAHARAAFPPDIEPEAPSLADL